MLPSRESEGQSDTLQPICPQCGGARECVLEQTPSVASYLISFISIFYFGIWSIFIIPLIFQSTKQIIKKCHYCNTEISRQKLFSIPSLSDQVLQFKCGNCIIVLSRKYAMVLLFIFVGIWFYFEIVREKPLIEEEPIPMSYSKWNQFLDDCGKYQLMDNGLRARSHFQKNYLGKQVDWEGYYVQFRINMDNSFPYSNWLYVKMDPTESSDDFPDLVIGVRSDIVSAVKTELNNIVQGQQILIKAEFKSLGNDFNYHMLELEEVKVLTEKKELHSIPQFVHADQLEKLKQDSSENKDKDETNPEQQNEEQEQKGTEIVNKLVEEDISDSHKKQIEEQRQKQQNQGTEKLIEENQENTQETNQIIEEDAQGNEEGQKIENEEKQQEKNEEQRNE